MTIALYNSYDRTKFREAHRRALARAGPIALAFDANLATFGFPYASDLKTPREIARWVAGTTSIGERGAYLIELADAGRYATYEFPRRGFPPQLGDVVITTNRPEPAKARDARTLATLLRSGRSLCIVFGLGPRGLDDREIYPLGAHHFDATGRGLSLETATAIGAVPAAIRAWLDASAKD